ncbi:MAG: U32 family peptidase, partial [Clostridia bacterium]|nr:U32 family peptidase [Clostridia bacterium]
VVRHYRQLLDLALSGQPYKVEPEAERELAQIFNRDFSTGYFFGKPGQDLMSYQRPNNRGLKIGRVKSLGHSAGVEIALEGDLALGDGLEVWVSEGGRLGFEVSQIILGKKSVSQAQAGQSVYIPIQGRVRLGDRIFKTNDAHLISKAQASYAQPSRIPLQFTVQAGLDQPLILQVQDELGNKIQVTGQIMGQKALKRPLDQEYLSKQLGRLGNTPYFLADLQAEIQGSVIYPASHLNDLRRQALEKLEDERLPLPPPGREITIKPAQSPSRSTSPTLLAVAVSHPEAVRAACQNGANLVYLDGYFRGFKPEFWLESQKIGQQYQVEIIPALPRITSDEDLELLKQDWQFWFKQGFRPSSLLIGNLGAGQAARQFWPQAKLISDWGFNIFNAYTAEALAGEYARLTLSPELTGQQIQALAQLPAEVIVQGALEMLISEYCLPGSALGGLTAQTPCSAPCQKQSFGLKDRLGAVFPLKTDRFCRMHLYNSRTLALIEETAALQSWGIAAIRIEARTESPGWTAKTTRLYRQALDGKTVTKAELEKLNGLTKGHFYRGVLENPDSK